MCCLQRYAPAGKEDETILKVMLADKVQSHLPSKSF